MSHLANDLWNDQLVETELEVRSQHVYSDYCRCLKCQDARDLSESDAYDLNRCHLV